MFQVATKKQSKLRMCISGPSGSGKTYTALAVATNLGEHVGVIDTEHGSASKYADKFYFQVVNLEPPFHPDRYVEAIHAAESAGFHVLVIDSLSHAWAGEGGLLEIVDQITTRTKAKNSYFAWGEGTKIQNKLFDAIIRSNLHIIVTMRSKTEYVVDTNAKGRSVPRKIGMAPIQRADSEYEFDIFAEMDIDNNFIVTKTRCSELTGQVINKPGSELAGTLHKWLDEGDPVLPQTTSQPAPNGEPVSNGKALDPKEEFTVLVKRMIADKEITREEGIKYVKDNNDDYSSALAQLKEHTA